MTELTKVRVSETHDGRRLVVVLSGGRGNVIDTAMASELEHVLTTRTTSPRLRCIALEAEGPHFSFGASVPEHAGEQVRGLLRGLHRVVLRLIRSEVPVVAAIRGACLGGALELALPCHRIIAAPDAKLGLPEVTLGMFAPAGSVLLPERVRRGLAEEMLLTGRVLSAEEARAAGLADDVAADPEAAAAHWFEQNLLNRSASAIRYATRGARETLVVRAEAGIARLERIFIEETARSRDAAEGIASFAAKRAPVWEES